MKTKIWAHRGASGYAPENTLEAFELAVKQGADGVELDVQFTKDNQLVVIHDEKLDRVSGKSGFVKDFTLEEIQKVNVNVPQKKYTSFAKIPTLQEVYELLKPTGLTVNVELKTGKLHYEGIEKAVLACAKEAGMEERICYSSFNHESLLRIKEIDSKALCGILFSDGWLHPAFYAKDYSFECLHPAFFDLTFPWFMKEARQAERKVHVWTVNNRDDLEKCYSLKVDAVITNYPDKAKEIRDEVE